MKCRIEIEYVDETGAKIRGVAETENVSYEGDHLGMIRAHASQAMLACGFTQTHVDEIFKAE